VVQAIINVTHSTCDTGIVSFDRLVQYSGDHAGDGIIAIGTVQFSSRSDCHSEQTTREDLIRLLDPIEITLDV
jgi:hypothetical protein